MKKIISYIFYGVSYLAATILAILLTLTITVYLFCKGPSPKAGNLFVTTFLETGQMKFVANLFLNSKEINKILSENSLKEMHNNVEEELIKVTNNKKELIEIHDISGNNFEGKMMIVNDPSKISLATTYPWGEYGKKLDELVKENNALAGVNGGLYVSAQNKGGRPRGVAVSNGQIQKIDSNIEGLHLIGFDQNNILRIIDLKNKNQKEIEKIIIDEKIRDAVAFQDDTSDKNNHFVKLIINGESRKLNGLGSGANPRTVIGQKKDGTVLILVTDGRGKNGHLGATAGDLIKIMEEYGAFNAANLDGGSSSSLYYKGKYLMTSVTFYYSNSSWRLPTAFIVKGSD